MNRAQRRAAGRNLHCVDCGTHRIAVQASYGWLCRPCHGVRISAIDEFAAAGNIIWQPIAVDGPAAPCYVTGCPRDADQGFAIRREFVPCCENHFGPAYEAAQRIQDGAA